MFQTALVSPSDASSYNKCYMILCSIILFRIVHHALSALLKHVVLFMLLHSLLKKPVDQPDS